MLGLLNQLEESYSQHPSTALQPYLEPQQEEYYQEDIQPTTTSSSHQDKKKKKDEHSNIIKLNINSNINTCELIW